MAESFENEKPIKAWLSTPEAQTLIRKAARSVLRVAREKRYSFTFMGLESATTLANGFVLEEVESALKLFILENRQGIQDKLLISGAKGGFVLRSAFIRDWIDATRNRRSDQWRYLYKRSLGAMREAKEFKRKARRDGAMFYSLTYKNGTISEFCAEDLVSIPFPQSLFSSATFEELNKAGSLLALAKHLWSELSNKSGGKPCWVPVRTLINWISAHVPIDKEQMFDQDRSGQGALERTPDHSLGPEALYFEREQIVRWAENFANSLEENQRSAFSLHHGDGLSLSSVAEELGYSGPSGPAYPIKEAMDKLKRFVRDLPWLSPPDANEEARALFMKALEADPDAYPNWAPRPRPMEEDDPRVYFREMEVEVGYNFSSTAVSGLLSELESCSLGLVYRTPSEAIADIRTKIPGIQWPFRPVNIEETIAAAQFPAEQYAMAAAISDRQVFKANLVTTRAGRVESIEPVEGEILQSRDKEEGLSIGGHVFLPEGPEISGFICFLRTDESRFIPPETLKWDEKGSFLATFQVFGPIQAKLCAAAIREVRDG